MVHKFKVDFHSLLPFRRVDGFDLGPVNYLFFYHYVVLKFSYESWTFKSWNINFIKPFDFFLAVCLWCSLHCPMTYSTTTSGCLALNYTLCCSTHGDFLSALFLVVPTLHTLFISLNMGGILHDPSHSRTNISCPRFSEHHKLHFSDEGGLDQLMEVLKVIEEERCRCCGWFDCSMWGNQASFCLYGFTFPSSMFLRS